MDNVYLVICKLATISYFHFPLLYNFVNAYVPASACVALYYTVTKAEFNSRKLHFTSPIYAFNKLYVIDIS